MVAIDMEIPQSCYDCDKKRYCEVGIDGGWRTDIRVEGCPLVEIGTCKDCKQLGVIDCGYYCKLNHWGKISKESNYGGMGDFYCSDFEKRDNNKPKTYIDCQKCENYRNPDYSKCMECGK